MQLFWRVQSSLFPFFFPTDGGHYQITYPKLGRQTNEKQQNSSCTEPPWQEQEQLSAFLLQRRQGFAPCCRRTTVLPLLLWALECGSHPANTSIGSLLTLAGIPHSDYFRWLSAVNAVSTLHVAWFASSAEQLPAVEVREASFSVCGISATRRVFRFLI